MMMLEVCVERDDVACVVVGELSAFDVACVVVGVVVAGDDAAGEVVVVVVSVDGAAGAVVVVESFDGGFELFGGGDWFDGAWQGVAVCCQRRKGLVRVAQMPHVFGLVKALAQPASMFHPALSKNEWVFIAVADTADRPG